MSQSNSEKATTSAKGKENHQTTEIKAEGNQKPNTQKPQNFVLPPADVRLEHRVMYDMAPEPTLLQKIKRFMTRLFGK